MLTFNNVGGKKFKDYKLDIEQNHVSLSKLCTGPKILNLTETYQLSRFIDMNMHAHVPVIYLRHVLLLNVIQIL